MNQYEFGGPSFPATKTLGAPCPFGMGLPHRYPYLAWRIGPVKVDRMKTMSSLHFFFSSVALLLPSVAASFAVAVCFPFSAGFFPIPATAVGRTAVEGKEGELLLGLQGKKMGKRSRGQMNRTAPLFPALKGETQNRGVTLQKVTILP